MSLISCHCSTPQYSSGDFEAPPFEIHAVHFQNKMRQTSNSVTDCIENTALRNDDALKLAVLSGLMLVQPPSHGRIQTPRALKICSTPDQKGMPFPLLAETAQIIIFRCSYCKKQLK